jgi:hypothetical protein
MNFPKVFILTILLGLIVPAVGAAGSGQITLSSDTDWLVANGADSAEITVQVLDGSGMPVANRTVALSVDPVFGRLTPATAITDASGTATARFVANTTSGIAVITARAEGVEGTLHQLIDHDLPYRISHLAYEPRVTVGTTTTITVGVTDRHGNPVDDRRDTETVGFSLGSVSDDARFLDGAEEVTELIRPLDATGNVTVTLRTDRYSAGSYWGENIVRISPPTAVPARYVTIYGTANGEPYTVEVLVSPSAWPVPYVPADGSGTFMVSYMLSDRYGNPCGNQEIRLDTGVPEEGRIVTTSSTGRATIEFGPSDVEREVTILATAVDNESVTAATPLLFYDPRPVGMHLSASPQSMPSADVPSTNAGALVRAKVVDQKGRPAAGELVTFEIRNILYGNCTQTAPPVLINATTDTNRSASVTALTDAEGFATVRFRPGSFAVSGESGHVSMATGSCDVFAHWGGVSQDVGLEWKNYPYVNVEAWYSPETVQVNETVDVTLRLTGDGWELQQLLPVDVVFCLDRGEDMLLNDGGKKDRVDRMEYAREAVANFTGNINSLGRANRVGLVTFGDITNGEGSPFADGWADLVRLEQDHKNFNWIQNVGADTDNTDTASYIAGHYPGNGNIRYENFAEVWVGLGDPLSGISYSAYGGADVNESLFRQVPLKKEGSGQASAPLRAGLHTSIWELAGHPSDRRDTVKAIVVLMQNEYRYFGDPFAEGKPLAVAPDSNTIAAGTKDYYAFGDCGSENMAEWARQNGIIIYPVYYAWGNSQAQENVPRRLAEQTGGKYFMADDYIQLNSALGEIVEDLKRHAGVDTVVNLDFGEVSVNNMTYSGSDAFDYIHEEGVSTLIQSYNRTATIIPASTRDDSANWTANHALRFDVGTIELGQVWEATFRLRAKTDGNIRIFGDTSRVSFNNNTESVPVPPLYIGSVIPNGTGDATGVLEIRNLRCTDPVPPANASGSVTVAWDRLYDGTLTATETVEYSLDGYAWVPFGGMSDGRGLLDRSVTLDTGNFPGGCYSLALRVRATAPDAPPAEEVLEIGVDRPLVFIKIS